MEYFFIGYLIVMAIALIVGLLSCWTNWISPEDGMFAGYILVGGGVMLMPLLELTLLSIK